MTFEDKKKLLSRLPHKLQVAFALYCAKDIMHLADSKDKDLINKIIKTIELWLIDKATDEEIKAVYNEAFIYYPDRFYIDSYAANVAAYAAAAVFTAAAYAAAAVYTVAAYASKASGKNIEFYYDHLLEMIKSMPELEKVIYGVDL